MTVGMQPGKLQGKGSPQSRVVYAGIRAALSRGEYPLNGRLPPETELALQFGVSRPTVRKALSQLRLERLITSRHGSGSYVLRRISTTMPSFGPVNSSEDIRRCFAFRSALEPAAAALAADFHDAGDIEEIARCHERMEDACRRNDKVAFLESDLLFHLAIARASQNPYFATSLEQMSRQIQTVMLSRSHHAFDQNSCWYEQVLSEHREIMNAIEGHSSMNAVDAMRLHLGSARRGMSEPSAERKHHAIQRT